LIKVAVKGAVRHAKRLPWLELGALFARELKQAWDRLTPHERHELNRLVRKSHGRPGNLTPAERDHVRKILRRGAGWS
jgi:hypothetical protein